MITTVSNDYMCPNPSSVCRNRKDNLILNECKVCESNHFHVKCPICGYEWNEFKFNKEKVI